jgi:hypothetical protein
MFDREMIPQRLEEMSYGLIVCSEVYWRCVFLQRLSDDDGD